MASLPFNVLTEARVGSIPHVQFVVFDSVLFEKRLQFILKSLLVVVFFLGVDV